MRSSNSISAIVCSASIPTNMDHPAGRGQLPVVTARYKRQLGLDRNGKLNVRGLTCATVQKPIKSTNYFPV
jgi:hypothetical protein